MTAVRDEYGFEVQKEYLPLFEAFKSVWQEEEKTRTAAWTEFLLEHVQLNEAQGRYESLRSLAEQGLQNAVSIISSDNDAEAKQRLSLLILKGIPFSIRGVTWKVLLDVSVRKQKGYYAMLVDAALGQLKHKDTLDIEIIKQQTAATAALLIESQQAQAQGRPADGGHTAAAAAAESAAAAAAAAVEEEDKAAAAGGRPPLPWVQGNPHAGKLDGKVWGSSGKTWLQQIEKDLPRTFPGHPVMQDSGCIVLRRVLAAYGGWMAGGRGGGLRLLTS